MKSGDLITRIDDSPVKGLTVDQAVKKMRGEPEHQGRPDDLPQGPKAAPSR
jgi:C-terminal processing protease CtpA/Prc